MKNVEGIAPEWQEEFDRFTETGNASEGFKAYLNNDAQAQQVVEKSFEEKSADLREALAEPPQIRPKAYRRPCPGSEKPEPIN